MDSLARKAVVDTLQAMKQRMDSLYRQSFRSDEEEYVSPGEGDEADVWHPQTDVWETDENWILMADLPGITDSDLQIEVVETRLVIRGTRNSRPSEEGLKPKQEERVQGSFSREFLLPLHAMTDGIQAELKRGVLTITIPKISGSRESSRKILIRAE
ncbi:MAG: Hsp20/alpha crystallin family protein [Syntrophobacteraceae bacterium]|nr:Hsp20/alpha crystallin family protein [Syntrophobacteraceae bacterium]